MSSPSPQAVIIAGPNGSGKSTAASILLPAEMPFVNADMIAQEISGKQGTPADINAGRLLLERVQSLEAQSLDFAFETTLATKMLASRVEGWKLAGYQTHLIFFYLPSPELAIQRVAARVRDGGHDVPEATIRRRFASGLRNFLELYSPLVDSWRLYDNSRGGDPQIIAKQRLTGELIVHDSVLWPGGLPPESPVRIVSEVDADSRFSSDEVVDPLIRTAMRRAVAEHKRRGNPIAIWKDGRVVQIPPEEIPPLEDAR